MLLRGTQKNSREELRNRFDRLKANVGVGGDGGSVETVRESLPEALKLMAEVLRQPSFPNEEFEQLRRSSLTSIDTQRSDPGALAGLALARHLNPYPPSTGCIPPRSTSAARGSRRSPSTTPSGATPISTAPPTANLRSWAISIRSRSRASRRNSSATGKARALTRESLCESPTSRRSTT